MCYKDSQGSSRFSEKVQYKAVYHRLTASEINAGKVKLCKFWNQRHVKFSLPVDATRIVAKKIELHFMAKKIKNAFFLLLLQTVVVIFQNYKEERVYSKSFHFITHAIRRARSRAKGCVRKIFGSATWQHKQQHSCEGHYKRTARKHNLLETWKTVRSLLKVRKSMIFQLPIKLNLSDIYFF